MVVLVVVEVASLLVVVAVDDDDDDCDVPEKSNLFKSSSNRVVSEFELSSIRISNRI